LAQNGTCSLKNYCFKHLLYSFTSSSEQFKLILHFSNSFSIISHFFSIQGVYNLGASGTIGDCVVFGDIIECAIDEPKPNPKPCLIESNKVGGLYKGNDVNGLCTGNDVGGLYVGNDVGGLYIGNDF
jgi:hypothetical protein